MFLGLVLLCTTKHNGMLPFDPVLQTFSISSSFQALTMLTVFRGKGTDSELEPQRGVSHNHSFIIVVLPGS